MNDTEWIDHPHHIDRFVSGYFMEVIKHRDGSCSWSVWDIEFIRATGRSRSVSRAKRQCMRAMNKHRKESQG